MNYEFKGTPGPWRVMTLIDNQFLRLDDRDSPYTGVISGSGHYDYNGKGFNITAVMSNADSHLISAAPELLDACQYLLKTMIDNPSIEGDYWDKRIEAARSAIHKALNIK